MALGLQWLLGQRVCEGRRGKLRQASERGVPPVKRRPRDLPSVPMTRTHSLPSAPFPSNAPVNAGKEGRQWGAASCVLHRYSELLLGKNMNKRNLSKKQKDKEKKKKVAGAGPGSHEQLFSSGSEQNH